MNRHTLRNRGMTLVELLVVVTIVGILSAIAVPAYRGYVLRVGRTDAKVALTSAAQTLERCYTRFNAYNDPMCPAIPATAPGAGTATYTITAVPAANSFTLKATRANGQADDADCGDFTLDEKGVQGTSGGTKPAVECWR
jgi:type IV pilus assembly protein PilE